MADNIISLVFCKACATTVASTKIETHPVCSFHQYEVYVEIPRFSDAYYMCSNFKDVDASLQRISAIMGSIF